MKAAAFSFVGIGLLIAALVAITPTLMPANQARTSRAIQNLAQSAAPAVVDEGEKATQAITAWIAGTQRSPRSAGQTYAVEEINGIAQVTADGLITLAQGIKGGVKVKTSLGIITAKLINTEAGTGKPPHQCRHMWKVQIPKLKAPVYICHDGLLDLLDLLRDGKVPPGLGS